MKKKLEYLMYACAFLLITLNFVTLTWSMWAQKSPSLLASTISIVVAVVMAVCFYVWPLFLGLGKGWFTSHWAKAGKRSMWTVQSIGYIYFKSNWIRFLLHSISAGIIVFTLYMIADICVLGTTSHIIDRLILAASFSGIFYSAIVIIAICRYRLYIRHTYNLPMSKHI